MEGLDNMKRVIIIGAGPAGLTAAYELLVRNSKFKVSVIEESGEMGGISKTVNVDGNRIDMGGHRFFSKDRRVTEWWARLLTPQGKPSIDDILLRNFLVKGLLCYRPLASSCLSRAQRDSR